ncbi:MAG: battenin family protein [archaeon]|nr:battenin family protein [archaeon]
MGTGCSFGEATLLGFLRLFPDGYVSGWSSGTGLAGVAGAGLTFLFKLKGTSSKWLYLGVSPICLIYFFCYFITSKIKDFCEETLYIRQSLGVDRPSNISQDKIEKGTENEENKDNSDIVKYKPANESNTNENEDNIGEEIIDSRPSIKFSVNKNKEMSCENFKLGFIECKRYILNLALVYYLEYLILSGIAERVNSKGIVVSEFFEGKLYETFSLCYQIGVLLSRSSLVIVKHIKYVEIFSLFQLGNLVFWFLLYFLKFITNPWPLFAHLIVVGLFGGAAYVGCFYHVLNSNDIHEDIKELCVNIGAIFNDVGILLSSLTAIALDNTIMKI